MTDHLSDGADLDDRPGRAPHLASSAPVRVARQNLTRPVMALPTPLGWICPLIPLLLILAAGAQAHGTHGHAPEGQPMEAVWSDESLVLPDIPVVDTATHRQGFVSRYAGAGPLLISFIYTNCTDTCPMVIGVMGLVDQALEQPGAPPLRLIVVTVDPDRDTPEVLARTAKDAGASRRWDWLAASTADTPALLAAFGLPPGPIESHPPLYLLGDLATGRFRRFSQVGDPAALVDMARALEAR